MAKQDAVLIIGGGIAGIQAALDLAEAGSRVVLVEKEPTIGGKMSVLDKNFPTLDCSVCIEAPKMSEVEQNKNIELLTMAELESLDGETGNFKARIRQKARFVSSECTRCADCVAVCPQVSSNAFTVGMSARKAIYTPIAQSIPGAYAIDIEQCLNEPPNYLPCNRCVVACGPKCIDFSMPGEKVLEREAVSVIVSTGYDLMDASQFKAYGYGSHPDILTSYELERILTSAGPTGGDIVRPSNRHHPKNALLVLCVGSRDRRYSSYCSRFCCMYSIKHAFQMIDHGVKDVTVLYMDLRAYGKGFDEFLKRTMDAGARFVRGRPATIKPNAEGNITVRYEDTSAGRVVNEDYEMVVLATAVRPSAGLPELSKRLGIELESDGFVHSVESKGGLLHTSRPGVYVAGCASSAKDIPDSVSEAGAAAALALTHLKSRSHPKPEEAPPIQGQEIPRVGVFICHCGSNIAGVVDVEKVCRGARDLPDVAHAQTQMFSCAGNTQKEIEQVIRDKKLTRV
ncbi:MAG: FAD-dependent oxidoreductase, partial [Elusimicrobiota bacterium]